MGKKRLPMFELSHQYHEETAALQQRVTEYSAGVREAEQQVKALTIFRDNALKAAVINGEDNEEKLQELNAELSNAKNALTLAKQKLEVARKIDTRKLTLQDVEQEFRAFTAAYQAEQLDPLIDELPKAKEQYVKKYLELTNALQHHQEQARAVTFLVYEQAQNVFWQNGRNRGAACSS